LERTNVRFIVQMQHKPVDVSHRNGDDNASTRRGPHDEDNRRLKGTTERILACPP
jgi:hypothetical protein